MRTVLLVEDDALVAAVAGDVLEDMGYQFVEAASVKAALEAAGPDVSRFDVAIVDVGLPDGKGDELALVLRELRADFPIIIASGYGESDLSARLRDMNQVVVLQKPYDSAQLLGALTSLGVK
jgi:DNA-binding response OmpR family regulator